MSNYLINPELNGSDFYFSGSSNSFLLIHGFTASTVEMKPLGDYLFQNGYTVQSPLLAGHATSPEDLFNVHWKDWADKCQAQFLKLLEKSNNIFVAGESMGGLLALWLAAHYPQIKGVIVFAPALRIRGIWKARLISPFRKIVPKTYTKKSQSTEVFPWQGYNVVIIPALLQLRKLQRVVYRLLPQINQPLLIFQGKKDHTIDPQSSQIIFDRSRSTNKELVWLENSGHCVILDQEYEAVYKKVLSFSSALCMDK